MEMYKFAVFIILINFVFGWMVQMDLVATAPDNYMAGKINESELTDALEVSAGGSAGFVETVFDSTQYVAGAVALFFKMLYYTTMGLPEMLRHEPFDFPDYIIDMIIAFQVVIYGVGIASFLRGFAVSGGQ